MNIIDKKFQELVESIQSKTKEEIYQEIKNSYETLSPTLKESLESYFAKFPDYWGKLKEEEGEYEELYNRVESLKNHIEDYIWLYHKLEDYRSKKLLLAILLNWYRFDIATTQTALEKNYNQYYDLDIIKSAKNEVFVDIGAYTGDSIISYINNYGINSYKKIYGYEMTQKSYKILENNTKYYPNVEVKNKAVTNKNKLLYLKEHEDSSANMIVEKSNYKIEAVSLDEDIKEPITIIKMDIEGSEEQALIGSKNHITKEKPKLLISVYHNHEDLWKLPKLIHSYVPEYHYYLRCYGNNIFPTEIVLFATID